MTPQGETRERKGLWVNKLAVGGDYFRAMSIPLLRGRLFDSRDTAQTPGVFVISQSLADRLWPGQSPLGRHVSIWRGEPREIVGIVADVKQDGLKQGPVQAVYEAFEQVGEKRRWLVGEMTFVLRPAGSTTLAVQRLRSSLLGIDKNVPLYDVALPDVVAANAADPRFYALLMGAFSLVAFVLTIAGIYGVVSYSVRRRTHELGVRMALGAERSNVIALVLREGMVLVAAGAVVGVAGSYAATRALARFLFRVGVTDPATSRHALRSSASSRWSRAIPARRATTMDPLRVLKYE